MPRFAEDYIHRIGRTGRANKKGLALSFVSPTDREHLRKIERFTGLKIETKVIPGMEPTKRASEHAEKKKRGGNGAPFNKSKRGFDKSRKTFKNRTNAKKRMNKKPSTSPTA